MVFWKVKQATGEMCVLPRQNDECSIRHSLMIGQCSTEHFAPAELEQPKYSTNNRLPEIDHTSESALSCLRSDRIIKGHSHVDASETLSDNNCSCCVDRLQQNYVIDQSPAFEKYNYLDNYLGKNLSSESNKSNETIIPSSCNLNRARVENPWKHQDIGIDSFLSSPVSITVSANEIISDDRESATIGTLSDKTLHIDDVTLCELNRAFIQTDSCEIATKKRKRICISSRLDKNECQAKEFILSHNEQGLLAMPRSNGNQNLVSNSEQERMRKISESFKDSLKGTLTIEGLKFVVQKLLPNSRVQRIKAFNDREGCLPMKGGENAHWAPFEDAILSFIEAQWNFRLDSGKCRRIYNRKRERLVKANAITEIYNKFICALCPDGAPRKDLMRMTKVTTRLKSLRRGCEYRKSQTGRIERGWAKGETKVFPEELAYLFKKAFEGTEFYQFVCREIRSKTIVEEFFEDMPKDPWKLV